MSRMHWMRKTAVSAVVAGAVALGAHSGARAEANPELMLKALGTTEGIGPIVTATFERASAALSEEDRALALKCWSEQVCETGRGDLTVALADGFGENVWRRVTHMEFVMQALRLPRGQQDHLYLGPGRRQQGDLRHEEPDRAGRRHHRDLPRCGPGVVADRPGSHGVRHHRGSLHRRSRRHRR